MSLKMRSRHLSLSEVKMPKKTFQAPISPVVREAMQNYYGDLAKRGVPLIPLEKCSLQLKITALAVSWVCAYWLAVNPARPV